MQKKAQLKPQSGIAALFGKLFGWLAAGGKPANAGEEELGEKVDDTVALVRGLLEKWPVPNVRLKRALQWRSDEEFGRQVNPWSQMIELGGIWSALKYYSLRNLSSGPMTTPTLQSQVSADDGS